MQGIGCVKVRNAASGMVEVHELSRVGHYRAFDLQTASAINAIEADSFTYGFTYGFSPLDTLFGAIKTRNTGTGTVEVHLMSRSSGYRDFVHQSGTAIPLSEADDFDFGFSTVTPGDLYCVKRRNTRLGRVEVQVFSRASRYQKSVLHVDTPIYEIDAPNFDFSARWSGLGIEGLLGIKHSNTPGTVELYATGRAYDSLILHTPSAFPIRPPSQFSYLFYPQLDQALLSVSLGAQPGGQMVVSQVSSPFTGTATLFSTPLGATDTANFVFKIIPEALHV